MGAARATFRFVLNGGRVSVSAPPMKRLLDVLRQELGLPGTKEGCGEGECGACSVLLDGRAVNSCLIPVAHADGGRVLTVEGLARGKRLHALQRAFVELGGSQCGICTPGMLISAYALLERRPRPSEADIREALAGNLCRCTGYTKIVDAVRAAAKEAAGGRRGGARRPRRTRSPSAASRPRASRSRRAPARRA